jgi:transposase
MAKIRSPKKQMAVDFMANINALEKALDTVSLPGSFLELLTIVIRLAHILFDDWLPKDSTNSSKSPSTDPNRPKKFKFRKSPKKRGGQDGHKGITLHQVTVPDEIIKLEVDPSQLPGDGWVFQGYEKRQVFDVEIKRHVIEYQAEIWVNKNGEKRKAEFPAKVIGLGLDEQVEQINQSVEPESTTPTDLTEQPDGQSDISTETESTSQTDQTEQTDGQSDCPAEAESTTPTDLTKQPDGQSDISAETESTSQTDQTDGQSDCPAETASTILIYQTGKPEGQSGIYIKQESASPANQSQQSSEPEQLSKVTAEFPENVNSPVQYSQRIKAIVVYMSVFQLLPFGRLGMFFNDILGQPISPGTFFTYKREAFDRLREFEVWVSCKLRQADLLHADETGVNIEGKRRWLHLVTTDLYVFYMVHEKRGSEAMKAMNILPHSQAVLCHDHWKPYYNLTNCQHSLCNAHHDRELTAVFELGYNWANRMSVFLLSVNELVNAAGGCLSEPAQEWVRTAYQEILNQADNECPDDAVKIPGKKGRPKKSKARNLLERLRDYQDDTLRFITDPIIPFTNNQAETDLRMNKVQQKISGCFRSWEGARIYCLIRSFIATCIKHGVAPYKGLMILFEGGLPDFIDLSEIDWSNLPEPVVTKSDSDGNEIEPDKTADIAA